MPMRVTYTFPPRRNGTLARIRARGEAGGYHRLAAPLTEREVRGSIGKDLADLERVLTPAS